MRTDSPDTIKILEPDRHILRKPEQITMNIQAVIRIIHLRKNHFLKIRFCIYRNYNSHTK